jgi:hypothetical protein
MTTQETFVTRLRRHRQRNQLTLEDLSRETNIRPDLLEALEQNDLTHWPRGLYARSWIRSYAAAVGLDPDDTVDEFCRLFPHGDRRAKGTMREIAGIVAHAPEYRDEIPHPTRRHDDTPQDVAVAESWHEPITRMARTIRARVTSLKLPSSTDRTPRTTTSES